MIHSALRPLSVLLMLGWLMAGPGIAQDTNAQCTVIFDAIWSAQTHPDDFPGPSAHFSPLIGATHTDQIVFWQPGDLATPGIQSVAETGATGTFSGEIQTQINAGTALEQISGGGIGTSPGSVSTSFDIGLSHPLVTLVTMIAPSPDWFVGVHDEPLFEHGSWSTDKVVQLPPYDAGTDSGPTFTSPNMPTIPAEVISLINAPPLAGGPSMGTFRFQCTSNLVFMDGFESGDMGSWTSSPTQ